MVPNSTSRHLGDVVILSAQGENEMDLWTHSIFSAIQGDGIWVLVGVYLDASGLYKSGGDESRKE